MILIPGASSLFAISGLEAIIAPDNSVYLRWEDTSDAEDGYHIFKRAGETVVEMIAAQPPDTIHYTDTEVSPDTEYNYLVMAMTPDVINLNATVSITTPPAWGIPQAVPEITFTSATEAVMSFNGSDAEYTTEQSMDLETWEIIQNETFLGRMDAFQHTFSTGESGPYFRIRSHVYEHPLEIGLDRPFETPPEPDGEMWDVTTFGASPARLDDANDDALFIRIVLGLAETGDIVYIPEGTYHLREVLEIPDGITLRGAGMDKTILITEGISLAIRIAAEAHDIRLENFAINYRGDTEELLYGVYIGSARQGTNSYRILIDSLRIERFAKHGVSVRDCHHVLVQNCEILNATNEGGGGFGYGVALNYPTNHNNWVRNNTIGPGIRHAVLLQYEAHNNLVEHNLAIGNSEDCYDLHGEDEYLNELRYNTARDSDKDGFGVGNTGSTHDRSGPNNWIHHNTVENCQAGIEVIQGSEMVFIDSNTFVDNAYGIRVYNGSGNHIYIRGNEIIGNERGISLLNSRWVWLEENQIENQTLYGIEILNGIEDLTERDNTLSGNARDYGP